jgi:hypothetical protein
MLTHQLQGYIMAWGNNSYHQLGLSGDPSQDPKKMKKPKELKPMKVGFVFPVIETCTDMHEVHEVHEMRALMPLTMHSARRMLLVPSGT